MNGIFFFFAFLFKSLFCEIISNLFAEFILNLFCFFMSRGTELYFTIKCMKTFNKTFLIRYDLLVKYLAAGQITYLNKTLKSRQYILLTILQCANITSVFLFMVQCQLFCLWLLFLQYTEADS